MTLPVFRNSQALFVVILRDPQAPQHLTEWTRTSTSIQARVEDHRMSLFDPNSLSLFVVTWSHSWDNILIWDVYQRRHIWV
jgi:hypothetical protein